MPAWKITQEQEEDAAGHRLATQHPAAWVASTDKPHQFQPTVRPRISIARLIPLNQLYVSGIFCCGEYWENVVTLRYLGLLVSIRLIFAFSRYLLCHERLTSIKLCVILDIAS